MRDWLSFVPPWALGLLTFVLGVVVLVMVYIRMRQLDLKVDRLGWVVGFLLILAGVYWTLAGDPWGPTLLLAGMLVQQILSRGQWRHGATPDQMLKGQRNAHS